ncbi:MAG TPA: hypothetical protein VGL99_10020 [Chloroflexota bacterium]
MPAPAKADAAELRQYMDELWQRLRLVARHSAPLPASAPGSVDWLASVGRFWWQARERAGLSRADLAQRLDRPLNQVRFFEFGLFSIQELKNGFLLDYARALGDPELVARFREEFEL